MNMKEDYYAEDHWRRIKRRYRASGRPGYCSHCWEEFLAWECAHPEMDPEDGPVHLLGGDPLDLHHVTYVRWDLPPDPRTGRFPGALYMERLADLEYRCRRHHPKGPDR